MAAEQFLSFYSYYIVGFMWGLFLRRWASPLFVLLVIWHYWIYGAIVGPEKFALGEFQFFLPLTVLFGVTIGYLLSSLLNLRRLIFWKEWDAYGFWLPLVLVEFILFHLVLGLWESTGTVARPLSYLLTFLAYLLMIPFFYFVTREFMVWAYWDPAKKQLSTEDNAAGRYHLFWSIFQLSATLIFLVFEWILPDVWPFWFALAATGFHVVLYVMINLFVISGVGQVPYKQMRSAVTSQLRKNAPVNAAMDFSMFGHSGDSGRQEMSILPTSNPNATGGKRPSGSSRGYSAGGSVSDNESRTKLNTFPLA
jgi:hypothetical protein